MYSGKFSLLLRVRRVHVSRLPPPPPYPTCFCFLVFTPAPTPARPHLIRCTVNDVTWIHDAPNHSVAPPGTQNLLAEQYERALGLIRAHRAKIDVLADALIEKGVVHKGELEEMLGEKVCTVSCSVDVRYERVVLAQLSKCAPYVWPYLTSDLTY